MYMPSRCRAEIPDKISGPLLDRIDLHVEVTPVAFSELSNTKTKGEPSSAIRERVIKAREMQQSVIKILKVCIAMRR
jgi:predicted ATPase with chaperone activity